MAKSTTGVKLREIVLTVGPALLSVVLVAAAFWAASKFVQPAPPMTLTIATASKGSPYWRVAERYQAQLAKNGVKLVIRETTGSFENLALLKDPNSGVHAALIQGGITSAADAPQLLSLGRIAYEPVWIFYRGDEPLERLSQLAGKRVLVGPAGGGTYFLATRLLAANGITQETATLIPMELPDYVEALSTGKADAGFLVLGPEARTVQRLLGTPGVRLMNMTQADAYAQRFPFLSRIELKHGVIDFGRNIPSADTTMVATLAAVVVHEDLHPALANLLTQTIVADRTQPVVGPNGEAPILQRLGEQSIGNDPEFPLSDEARRVYRSGTPFLQRFLPFWLATLADRMTVMLVPILGVLLPMLRFGPMLYQWQVRRRLLYWYRELKNVELGLNASAGPDVITVKRVRIEEIEAAVNEIPIPLPYTNQLYELRSHIDMVRRRLADLGVPAR